VADLKRVDPHGRALLRCSEEVEASIVAIASRYDLPGDLAVGAAAGAVTRIMGKVATAAFVENREDGLAIGRDFVDVLREMARVTEELVDGLEGLTPPKERKARELGKEER